MSTLKRLRHRKSKTNARSYIVSSFSAFPVSSSNHILAFISQRIIGQPAQETLPSLKAYIYAVKGAIMPSLLLTHDSVPQLLQLLSSIEHWRLALLKSVADAIIHDQYYTKTRAHADTLLPKEREHLDSLLGDSSMQRQAYISILGLLCQVVSTQLTSVC